MVKSILVECAASQREGDKLWRCEKNWARIHELTLKIHTVKMGLASNAVEHLLLRPFLCYCFGSAVKITVKRLLTHRDKQKYLSKAF